uniref:Calcium and integrin binding 1 n=1 Tax=Calidris pygmaea TaxID=425635 RepID=A0A8C3PLV1_9CHAR
MGGSASLLPREALGEYQANPFQHRICRVFSTSGNGDDSMSFEDFLDMLSVFSDSATLDIKSHYAFRIFDFDEDGTLDRSDLEKLVDCLTGQGEESRLSNAEMEQLIQNVRPMRLGTGHYRFLALQSSPLAFPSPQILEESDIDKDGTINLSEFQHVISRSPDFVRYDVLQLHGLSRGGLSGGFAGVGAELWVVVGQGYPVRGNRVLRELCKILSRTG